MRIQHNIMAMSAYRNYTNNVSAMKKNLEKLSSGYKINRAGDDAAGLAISEKMRAQITGLETAQKNAKDGISLVQTAEGALTEVHDMLNRMVELATQSANGTYDNTTDRNQMQKEINQLRSEINRIADSSNFNGINLLDGTMALSSETFEVAHQAGSSVAQGMKYTNVAIATGNFGAKATSHFTGSVSGKTAQFKIDLADMEFTAKKTAGGSFSATKFDVVVAGQTITATVAASAIGTDGKITATDIAGALKAAFNSGVKTTASAAAGTAGHVIGTANSVFKATVSGTVLTFNYVGKASTGVMATTALTGTAEAAAINTALKSGEVTVTPTTTDTKPAAGKLVDCHIYDITESVYAPAAQRAGIDLTLDNTIVKQGNKLTIDGKTFIFQTGTATLGSAAIGTATLINVSKASDKIREAVVKLARTSNATTNFEINAVGANKIHIDQKTTSFPTKKYSYDDLKKVFTLAKQTTPAAVTSGAVTTISLKGSGDAMIPQNSQITINGKDYKFVDASTAAAKATATDAVYIDVAQGLNGLKSKLSSLGTVTVSTDGKTLTITGTNAAATAAATVTFNGLGLTLQIGDTADPWNQLNVNINDCHTHSLGIADISIADQKDAQTAVDKIKAAINYVSDVRGTLGATQNRLDHTINNLSVMTENIQDAESTIRDTDVAEEMMAYTKNNILIQSAQAMLAQANQVPQGVLQLLQ